MTSTPAGGAAEHFTYGYDVHGSVSLLLDGAGAAKASYGYRPYGEADTDLTKGDTEEDDPFNPYRYTAKRFDSGSKSLDMGARRFGPAINRFLQPDLYDGALDNLGLSMDPLTGNRYSLAGGSPLSYIEADGHVIFRDGDAGALDKSSTSSSSGSSGSSRHKGLSLSDSFGFFKGIFEAGSETVVGLGQLSWQQMARQGLRGKGSFRAQAREDREVLEFFVRNPKKATKAVWHGATDPVRDDWREGNEGEAEGRVGFEILGLFFGTKGLHKVSKVARVSRAPNTAGARFVAGSDGVVTDLVGAAPSAVSIGHYPAYVNAGARTGARTFSMSDEAWNAMSPTEQWVRNQR